MISLTVLLAAPLLIQAQEGGGCLKYKNYSTDIDFELVSEPVRFIYTTPRDSLTGQSQERTREWLKKHKGNRWISGATDHKSWHTNGITSGSMRVESSAQLLAMPYDRYGAYYCPYVKSLKIRVYYESEISIAKELKRGSCEFDAVMHHEMKHHAANEAVAQTIAKRMRTDLPEMLDIMESRYVRRSDVDASFEMMKESLSDILKVYSGEMSERMREFNGHIDTPEEYRAVAGACKK